MKNWYAAHHFALERQHHLLRERARAQQIRRAGRNPGREPWFRDLLLRVRNLHRQAFRLETAETRP